MSEYIKAKSENVVLYGNGKILHENICWLNLLYNVLGITGSDVLESCPERKQYTKEDALQFKYDKIIITTDYYDEVKSELVSRYQVPIQKIFSYRDDFTERKFSFGDENPDITFLVFRVTCEIKNNGFMNFYNSVVEMYYYAKQQGYELVVDMKNYFSLYTEIESYGQKNTWEDFFKQPSAYSLEEVYRSKNVILSKWNTYPMQIEPYSSYYKQIHQIARTCGKNIEYSDLFKNFLLREMKKIKNKKILGVLARGTSYFVMRPKGHPIPTETNKFIANVEKMMADNNYEYVYLATEDKLIFEQFKLKFGEKLLYTEQNRMVASEDEALHLDNKWEWANRFYEEMYDKKNNNPALEYNLVIAMLAQCSGLIANCICGGAKGAIYQNGGEYKVVDVNYNGLF